MPSTTRKKKSRTKRSGTRFSELAIERIAEIVSQPPNVASGSDACQIMSITIADNDLTDIGATGFWQWQLNEIFGTDALIEFYEFVCLLEVAVQSGYVDLSDWAGLDQLQRSLALIANEDLELSQFELHLPTALLERLHKGNLCVSSWDPRAYSAFASLLHLESCIRTDTHACHFLYRVNEAGAWEDDLSFLLDEEFFVNELADGLQPDSTPNPILGGLAMLQYLSWFERILRRIEHHDELMHAFTLQARWSHRIAPTLKRVDTWAGRMAEWNEFGVDQEGEAAWHDFKGDLRIVSGEVDRLQIPIRVASDSEAGRTVDELIAEGRIGAARRKAHTLARRRRAAADFTVVDDPTQLDFLTACERLAEIGDPRGAAALVAPFAEKFSKGNRDRLQKLLAGARLSKPPEPSPGVVMQEQILLPTPSTAYPRDKPKYRETGRLKEDE